MIMHGAVLVLSLGLAGFAGSHGLVGSSGAADHPWNPFVSVEGSLLAECFHSADLTITHASATPWATVVADSDEVTDPISANPGHAEVSGQRVTDYAPDYAGPSSPAVEGIEWRFRGDATSAHRSASFSGRVDFTTDEPAHVLIRAAFPGHGSVELDEIRGDYHYSITIIPSPLFHRRAILAPGEHTLEFSGYYDDIKGIDLDAGLDLLVRFEPVSCAIIDLNADGVLDHGDISLFIMLYLAGC
ncbi:MAG: hypothetical protein ACF8Q5_04295 [Phycisphaerales bacterium JB040]